MSTVTDLESYQQFALQQQAQNNAWSAEQAQKQMDFQREMSNSAHQREVADLRAAGLNPILSANSGASVPNGAAAEGDRSAAANIGGILQQVLQAQSAREVAAMYNAATINAASIAANASMYGADVNATTQREYPNSFAGIVERVIRAIQGDESGATSNAAKVVQSAGVKAKQAFINAGNFFKSLRDPNYQKLISWMNQNHIPLSKKLGYGSQQFIYAMRLFQSGKFNLLKSFLQQFR